MNRTRIPRDLTCDRCTRAYRFDPDAEDYLVHITTGSHVAQICLFLLTETRHIPAQLLQTSPPTGTRGVNPGT
jgi:transcriptional regulatory protein RtcR